MNLAADEPRLWIKRGEYTSFNGLRALAILAVFICHYGSVASPYLGPGLWWTGVDLFFVLSGFLITGILFQDRYSPAYFRNFYTRRALRILPVYWGFLLSIFILAKPLHLQYDRWLWTYMAFAQNLSTRTVLIHPGSRPNFNLITSGHVQLEIGVFWSLCVEEQFYLLWPLVIRAVRDRERLLRLALGGCLFVLCIRCALFRFDHAAVQLSAYVYNQPYTRFDGMLLGAALNLWLQGHKLSIHRLRTYAARGIGLGSLSLVVALLTLGHHHALGADNPVMETFGYSLVALVAASVLLLTLDETHPVARALRHKLLYRLGAISYGFYVFHNLGHLMFQRQAEHTSAGRRPLIALEAFVITLVFAIASFTTLERFFLSLKKYLAPAAHKAVPDELELVPK